jgi:hypothetical protein
LLNFCKNLSSSSSKCDDESEGSLNLALCIGRLEIELLIEDLNKEASRLDKLKLKLLEHKENQKHQQEMQQQQLKQELQDEPKQKEATTFVSEKSSPPTSTVVEKSILNKLSDAMREDASLSRCDEFELINKGSDKEMMRSYLKFVYGMSSEAPSVSSRIRTLNDDSSSSSLSLSLSTQMDLNSTSQRSFSVSYSATSGSGASVASVTAVAGVTAATTNTTTAKVVSKATTLTSTPSSSSSGFFSSLTSSSKKSSSSNKSLNKLFPSLSGSSNQPTTTLSALQQQQQQQQQNVDLLSENDLLYDDTDNMTVIMNLEQDDTSSLISYTDMDIQSLSMQQLHKEAPTSNIPKASSTFSISSSSSSSLSAQNSSSGYGSVQGSVNKHTMTTANANKMASIANSTTTINSNEQGSLTLKQNIDDVEPICVASASTSEFNRHLTPVSLFPDTTSETCNVECQTRKAMLNVKITLTEMRIYAQKESSGSCALVDIEQLELHNSKSSAVQTDRAKEIYICFVKRADERDANDLDDEGEKWPSSELAAIRELGMAHVSLENIRLEVDVPILNGVLEFLDDNDLFDLTADGVNNKPTQPARVLIRDCLFRLNNECAESKLNKPQDILIKHLLVRKLSNNEIRLCVTPSPPFPFSPSLGQTKCPAVSSFEIEKRRKTSRLTSIRNDVLLTSIKNYEMSQNYANQLASLIQMLRKSKEENKQLKAKMNEKVVTASRREEASVETIAQYKASEISANMENERRQFESLLKQHQNENEALKEKLKTLEQQLALMTIEKERLIKRLTS